MNPPTSVALGGARVALANLNPPTSVTLGGARGFKFIANTNDDLGESARGDFIANTNPPTSVTSRGAFVKVLTTVCCCEKLYH